MDNERQVSGCIYARPDDFEKDGYEYTIRANQQGWGLPTKNLEPEDLRKLADELEELRHNE